MFISKKRWEEMQDRIYKLERGQKIAYSRETVGPTVLPFSGLLIPLHQRDVTLPVNQAVQLILDHLDLKIDDTPVKVELVKKDAK
jgi:hypothetical protein